MDDDLINDLFDNLKIKLSKQDIIKLYRGRCIRCNIEFNLNIHEIEYRSERPKTFDWWENQVTLCYDCHNFIHHTGSKGKILLHNLQNRRLLAYYGRTIDRTD